MCMKIFLLLFRFHLINLFLVFQVFRNLFLANQKVITFDLFLCSSFFICVVTRVVIWRCFLLFQFHFHKPFLVFQEFRIPIIRWRKGNNFRVFFSFFFIFHMYSCMCCCLNVFFVCFYFVFIIFCFVFQVLNFSPEASAPLTHSPTTLLHFFSPFSLLYSFFLTLSASLWSFFFSSVLSGFLLLLKRRSKIFEDPKRSSQAEGWKINMKFYFYYFSIFWVWF